MDGGVEPCLVGRAKFVREGGGSDTPTRWPIRHGPWSGGRISRATAGWPRHEQTYLPRLQRHNPGGARGGGGHAALPAGALRQSVLHPSLWPTGTGGGGAGAGAGRHLDRCTAREIVFTGSATEANNLGILGVARALRARGGYLVTSAIEHPAVARPMAHLQEQGWDLGVLAVDGDGRVSLDELARSLRDFTVLVSVMHANNEVGTCSP